MIRMGEIINAVRRYLSGLFAPGYVVNDVNIRRPEDYLNNNGSGYFEPNETLNVK